MAHSGSDIFNGLSYFLIAAVFFYLDSKRQDLPYSWIFRLFVVFIFACGSTYFFAAWPIYVFPYLIEGLVKVETASISIIAALLFIPFLSKNHNLVQFIQKRLEFSGY